MTDVRDTSRVRTLILPAVVLMALLFSTTSCASSVIVESIDTDLVPGPVKLSILLPPGYETSNTTYPLFFWLHGGAGTNRFLQRNAIIFQKMWRDGSIPKMVVVTPNAERSFYLDYRDGSEKWETFITQELLAHMRENYRVSTERSQTFVGGISMGGMGSLRLGLKHRDLFGVIVAMEPGIEPAYEWKDVRLQDKFWRDDELLEARFGSPIDEAYWAANNPATIVRDEATSIRDSGIAIYIEVGSEDAFGLDRGTEFLHRTLYDNDIRHEYRYVLGADHVGKTMKERIPNALSFLQRVTTPPERDIQVNLLRRQIDRMKRDARD